MRISHSNKFVFLATPRTASTSVRDALDDYSDVKSVFKAQATREFPFYHHISSKELREYFANYGWDWDDYSKVCFVRNPFDRVVSLFHHHIETGERYAEGKSKIYNFTRSIKYKYFNRIDFENFVSQLDPTARLQTSVCRFIDEGENDLGNTQVLKYENLPVCFAKWATGAGIPEAADGLSRINVTGRRLDYREYYTDRTIELVSSLYSDDIARFDYSFG